MDVQNFKLKTKQKILHPHYVDHDHLVHLVLQDQEAAIDHGLAGVVRVANIHLNLPNVIDPKILAKMSKSKSIINK